MSDVNTQDKNGRTKLILALEDGDYNMCRSLVQLGADTNIRDTWGRTAVIWAALYGYDNIVQLLCGAGADLNIRDEWGHTAVMYAARMGELNIVQLLCDADAELNIVDDDGDGMTAVMFAAERGHEKIVQLVHEAGANTSSRDDCGRSALDIAARKKNYPICLYLIHTGADYSRTKNIILELAADHGDLTMTKFLIDGGADVTKAPVLYCSSYNGDLDQCQLWAQAGAAINKQNSSGYTPVNIAAKQGYKHLCEYFMKLGSDLNISDKEGLTPLYFMSQDGDNYLVRKLLDHGASVDSAGCLQVALDNYNQEVAATLIERGCDVNKARVI